MILNAVMSAVDLCYATLWHTSHLNAASWVVLPSARGMQREWGESCLLNRVLKKEFQGGLVSFSRSEKPVRWLGGTFILIFQQVWWFPLGPGQARTSMHVSRNRSFTQQMLIKLLLHDTPCAVCRGHSGEQKGHSPNLRGTWRWGNRQ